MKYNERVFESLNEIALISEECIAGLYEGCRRYCPVLYQIADSLGTLDFLTSLAYYSLTVSTVRPEFSDTLAIKNSRHPLYEMTRDQIPNNFFCCDGLRFHFVTGPNMSGKSTYIKQAGVLTVLAQLGSFVPAEFASFRIIDRLFTRLHVEDAFEQNLSSFKMEVKEMMFIMENLTNQSLVLIDEFGRSTNPTDGMAINAAVCEILSSSCAFIYSVTHFYTVVNAFAGFPHVNVLHLKVENNTDFHYNVQNGVFSGSNYGIDLAAKFFDADLFEKQERLLRQSNQPMRSRA